jgi:hypothetical protein
MKFYLILFFTLINKMRRTFTRSTPKNKTENKPRVLPLIRSTPDRPVMKRPISQPVILGDESTQNNTIASSNNPSNNYLADLVSPITLQKAPESPLNKINMENPEPSPSTWEIKYTSLSELSGIEENDRKIAMRNSRNTSSTFVFQPLSPNLSANSPNDLILVNPAKNLYYTREMIETEKVNQLKSLERKTEILKSRGTNSLIVPFVRPPVIPFVQPFATSETIEAPHMTLETIQISPNSQYNVNDDINMISSDHLNQ